MNLNSQRASASSTGRAARPAWVSALVILLGAGSIAFLGGCHAPPPPDADANAFTLSDTMLHRIQLDTVLEKPVEEVIDLNGHIAPDGEKLADIYPIVGGQVLSVDAELGDHVTKGQTLAVIRSSEVADMTHQLSDAESDVTVAHKNLNVQQDLFNSKLISERDLVSAQQESDKAEAQLKRMQESFAIYHFQNGSEYDVKAPTSGYIIAKDIAPDVMLPADQNTKIFTVAELDEVWVLADVYESDISRVKEGMPAEITTLSYPGKVYHGKVDKIYNLLDPETRTERIRIRLPNPDISLKPEMIAHVELRFQQDRSLPSIPSGAIIEDNGHQYVMVFKDRFNLSTREITTDHSNGGTTWVSAGLKPGETIVGKEQLYLYDALNDH